MPTLRPLLFLAVLVAGCASSPPAGESGATVPSVLAAVCDAAGGNDVVEAEAAFARAHDGLHTLARELQDVDRRDVAADLLEAKQRVEAAFANEPVPDDLSGRVDALVDATAEALAATGGPRASCSEDTP